MQYVYAIYLTVGFVCAVVNLFNAIWQIFRCRASLDDLHITILLYLARFTTLIFLWPLVIWACWNSIRYDVTLLLRSLGLVSSSLVSSSYEPHFMAKKEWLTKKVTIGEAEQSNLVTLPALGPHPVPFGYVNHQWKILLSHMQNGDEIWEFNYVAPRASRHGYVLMRDEEMIFEVLTSMG